MIQIPVSVGELLDKLSILNIKSFRILDKEKARIVRNELSHISSLAEPFLRNHEMEDYYTDLLTVNINLWEIEDRIRDFEKRKLFNDEFIQLARKVYLTNDERFEIKKKINQFTESDIQEVKQYIDYKT